MACSLIFYVYVWIIIAHNKIIEVDGFVLLSNECQSRKVELSIEMGKRQKVKKENQFKLQNQEEKWVSGCIIKGW